MRVGANIRKRSDGRYEARYIKERDAQGRIVYGYCYGKSYDEVAEKKNRILGISPIHRINGVVNEAEEKQALPKVRRMNLLILGAGGQGQVVKEIAESIGIFYKISFLDDNPENELAIGKIDECGSFLAEYPIAIPSVGNCTLRMEWIEKLIQEGFILPTLISPYATVSPSAEIAYGTLVEPKAILGANTKIGAGCIISAGAIVDRDSIIEDGCHIGCAAKVMKNSIVNTRMVVV